MRTTEPSPRSRKVTPSPGAPRHPLPQGGEGQLPKNQPSPPWGRGWRGAPGEGVTAEIFGAEHRCAAAIANCKAGRLTRFIVALLLIACASFGTSCRERLATAKPDPLSGAYDTEQDWNDPQRVIPLNYQQVQGKRVFYQYCVWCHADSSPAGPSNRSNLNPTPPLASDGATFNALSDDFLRNTITLGGGAMGKSALMPPWGKTLKPADIDAVIAFYRAIAQPSYQPPARPGPKYSVR